MSDETRDPSANTQAFRAFVQRDEPAPPARPNIALLAGGGIAALVVIGLVLALIFG